MESRVNLTDKWMDGWMDQSIYRVGNRNKQIYKFIFSISDPRCHNDLVIVSNRDRFHWPHWASSSVHRTADHSSYDHFGGRGTLQGSSR